VADLCSIRIDVNKRAVGAKYGAMVPAILQGVAKLDAADAAEKAAAGECVSVQAGEETILLEPGELSVEKSYGDDWVAAEDQQTVVLLDKRITLELKQEGIARDVVRNVQNLRKDAGLEIEDRIVLSLQSDNADLMAAIDAFKDYIARETLAASVQSQPLTDGAAATEVKLAGGQLAVALRKA
jgi:isoleucyl-tRNA synthetase